MLNLTKGRGGYLGSRLGEKFSQLWDNFIEQVRQAKIFFLPYKTKIRFRDMEMQVN